MKSTRRSLDISTDNPPNTSYLCKGILDCDYKKCDRYKDEKCDKVDLLLSFSQLPHYIVQKKMRRCSASGWKVFTFLMDKAIQKEDSRYFGQCYSHYGDIAEVTGLSKNNIGAKMKELVKLGLITHRYKRFTGRGGEIRTGNIFTICHLFRRRELNPYA